jgi:hypothetical protein
MTTELAAVLGACVFAHADCHQPASECCGVLGDCGALLVAERSALQAGGLTELPPGLAQTVQARDAVHGGLTLRAPEPDDRGGCW